MKADGPNFVATLDLLGKASDEEGDGGDKDGGVDEEDVEEVTAGDSGEGLEKVSGDREAQFCGRLTLNYLIKFSYIIFKILPTGLFMGLVDTKRTRGLRSKTGQEITTNPSSVR